MARLEVSYFVIRAKDLLEALRRVRDEDSPDLVYLELHANSVHENVEGAD